MFGVQSSARRTVCSAVGGAAVAVALVLVAVALAVVTAGDAVAEATVGGAGAVVAAVGATGAGVAVGAVPHAASSSRPVSRAAPKREKRCMVRYFPFFRRLRPPGRSARGV